jgi:nucleotide-binding universal stress UspA family protein
MIIAAALSHRADTIVMCSHGRTGFTRWILGSVSQKVVRHAPLPVLVLRDGGPIPGVGTTGAAPEVSVLVPLDGSALAEAALQPAARLVAALAGTVSGRLSLVRIVDIPFPRPQAGSNIPAETIGRQLQQSVHDEAKAYLEQTAARVRGMLPQGSPVSVTTTVRFDVDAGEAIAAAAEGKPDPQGNPSSPSDVIVITTHGRGGLALWAMGSVTERVLARTQHTLLVVRPDEVVAKQADALQSLRDLATAHGTHEESDVSPSA